VIVEICVESLASATAADRAGADRIELCSDLHVGGVTPPASLIRDVRDALTHAKLHVLVRPRPGDFVYSAHEIATMKRSIDEAKTLGADGAVLGVLKNGGRIDVNATRELTKRARPMAVTFHRAFDRSPDMMSALDDVIDVGCDRILTAGGAKPDGAEPVSALDGAAGLRTLVTAARNRIIVLAAGGIRATNVRDLIATTGVPEVHSSLLSHATTARTATGTLAAITEQQVHDFLSAARSY
jgi:copper homeostasis protein